MTKVIKLKTGNRFEDLASYSRLVAVGDMIFVSNTAGRHPETKEMPETLEGQLNQVLANIDRALVAVGSGLADLVNLQVFVPDPADGDAVGAILGERFRGIDPACTMICSPLGSPIYKVEIAATAWRGAGRAEVERIDLGGRP